MKKIIALSIAVAIANVISYAKADTPAAPRADSDLNAARDTVINIKNATNVVITESPEGVKMTVKGTESDPGFQTVYTSEYQEGAVVTSRQEFDMPYLFRAKTQRTHQLIMFSGLHAGFCGSVNANGIDIEMGKSYEIGIDNLIAYELCLPGMSDIFSIGTGINWRNYRMTGETRFIQQDGVMSTGNYPEGTEGRFSRIKIFSLGFPVMYMHKFPVKMLARTNLKIKIGAILNWNSYGSVKTAWTEPDGTKAEEFNKRIGQRKFSVDIMAAVQIAPWTGLYFKYSPMDLFKDGRGPEFQTLSTGIYLSF